MDIFGAAATTATVTVALDGGTPQPTTRQGEFFFKQLTVNNSAVAQYPSLKITGVKNLIGASGEDALTEITKTTYLPKTPEVFTYDADGNLTDDARWHYTWDAENRLIAMEPSTVGGALRPDSVRLEFAYDGQSRRISKKVFSWSGSTWTLASHTLFIHDGWNLLAELNALNSNAVVSTYVWGSDLSGSLQGAGGVGGLLFSNLGTATHASAFDGNGNTIGLVDMATGVKSATYDYNAFGETIQSDGVASVANHFRFSTKYTDDETGLLNYGFRYYNPSMGRWLSRDPIEERGGVNIYAFVYNDGINRFDPYGLFSGFGPTGPVNTGNYPTRPAGPMDNVPDWARNGANNINLPDISLVSGVSGSVTTCVGIVGGAVCAAVSTAIETGTCCNNGSRKTYYRQQVTARIFIRAGAWSPVSARVRANVVRDLDECPTLGNSSDGALFVRATAGMVFGECTWRPNRGWRCTGGFTGPLSLVNADVGGSFTVRNVTWQ